MKQLSRLPGKTLVRLAAMLLSCTALLGCAPALVSVYREGPLGHYSREIGTQVSEAVTIHRQGQRIESRLPVTLLPGDTMQTRAGTVAVIRYADGGQVVLDANTRVHIGSLFVEFGRILAQVHGLFAADTESVITGVEGTEYTLEARRDGSVAVIVLDGVVVCRSRSGSWDPVRVTGGQAFLAEIPGRLRPEIRPASASEMEDIRGLRCTSEGSGPQCRQGGFCCDDGRIFGSTRQSCRGFFSPSEKEAVQRCEEALAGYCCDRGRVVRAARDQCERYRGAYFADRASAERACRVPAEQGFCCARGKVFAASPEICENAKGSFHGSESAAIRSCEEEAQSGYCCRGGQVGRADPAACQRMRGTYFRSRDEAEQSCRASPETDYCCARGEVFAATRERCARLKGSFHADRVRAARACMRSIPTAPNSPQGDTYPLR